MPSRSTRARYAAAGLCLCGQDKVPGRAKCKRCQDAVNASVKLWKMRKQAEGLCRCGRELVTKSKCQGCIERQQNLQRANFFAALDAYGGRQCSCCNED